jgi:hypothetical protein
MQRRAQLPWATFLALAAACPRNGGGNAQGPPLDEAVRLATMEASQAVYLANLTKSKAERDAALVNFFRSQAAIEAAGVSETNNVWARFTDGTFYFEFDNSGPSPNLPSEPHLDGGSGATPAPAPFLEDLPAAPTVIAANSLEPGWTDASGEIGTWLSDAGYTVQRMKLTVDELEQTSNVGVLIWQTHSGEGNVRGQLPDGGQPVEFSFLTGTVATEALGRGKYKSLRDDGSLAVGGVTWKEGGVEKKELRYAITQKYIRNRLHGKFGADALVGIDSCTSALADPAWEQAGVAHYVGWSHIVGDLGSTSFRRYFDRLLGANAAAPFSTPKERPFAANAVQNWMQAAGYDLDQSIFENNTPSKAKLEFHHHPANGDFAILRPAILRVLAFVGQKNYQFTLDGTFGDDPGPGKRSASYGGVPLDIVQWNHDSVILDLPLTLPSGRVELALSTRKSLAVPITEWLIPFTFTYHDQETLQYVIKVNCRLRADVRGFRNAPGDSLIWSPPIPASSLTDVSGSLVASGQLHDSTGQLVDAWSGGSALTPLDPTQAIPQNYALCVGAFDQATSTLQRFIVTAAGAYNSTLSGVSAGEIQNIAVPMTLTMDWATLRINGDTLNATGVNGTLQWPSVLPANVPVDADGR